jgi:hypothetical protein
MPHLALFPLVLGLFQPPAEPAAAAAPQAASVVRTSAWKQSMSTVAPQNAKKGILLLVRLRDYAALRGRRFHPALLGAMT